MTLLALENLTVWRGARTVLDKASFVLSEGECVGLIGPNGAGKTTLMSAALGLLPHEGASSLAQLPPNERARRAAWLPQSREIAWPMPVERVIALGRIPHLPRGTRPGPIDQTAIDRAIAATDLAEERTRRATDLSGGEQARVLIARALAQDTPLLLADEPIAGLDPAHQISTMARFAAMAADGRGVLCALHDLGLAARHCTRLILLYQGRIHADGTPEEVLTQENMSHVFGIRAHFQMTNHGPVFQPLEVLQ